MNEKSSQTMCKMGTSRNNLNEELIKCFDLVKRMMDFERQHFHDIEFNNFFHFLFNKSAFNISGDKIIKIS